MGLPMMLELGIFSQEDLRAVFIFARVLHDLANVFQTAMSPLVPSTVAARELGIAAIERAFQDASRGNSVSR